MKPITLLLVTCADSATAQKLATGLIEKRLAACVLVDQVQSFYMWHNALQSESEYRLLIKSVPELNDALVSYLSEIHPYEIPGILSWSAMANDAYVDWARAATKDFIE